MCETAVVGERILPPPYVRRNDYQRGGGGRKEKNKKKRENECTAVQVRRSLPTGCFVREKGKKSRRGREGTYT